MKESDQNLTSGDELVEETNLSLLNKTQEYLRLALSSQRPHSILVRAWDEFYRLYNKLIRRYVLSHHCPLSEVDDCVQEVWAAVAKHLADFQRPKDRPGLRAWLYSVVRNTTATVLRKRLRQEAGIQRYREMISANQHAGSEDPSHGDWTRLLLETLLDDAAQTEPELSCRIFRMRLLENYTTREIAEKLEVSPHVIRYRYRQLLDTLRQRMEVYTGERIEIRTSRKRHPNSAHPNTDHSETASPHPSNPE